MSRVLQIAEGQEAEGGVTLRQQLMSMDQLQLVALLEEATAKEMHATKLAERALRRLQDAHEIGKTLTQSHEDEMERVIFTIYEECSGGHATSSHVLTDLLSRAFQTLLAETGGRRTALAKFMTKMVADTVNAMDTVPADDWADPIMEQFYLLAALGQINPAMSGLITYGSQSEYWFDRGRKLYQSRET